MFYKLIPEFVEQGKKAFWDGIDIFANPYDEGKQRNYFESWLHGWIEGHRENDWLPYDKRKKPPIYARGF